MKSEKRTENREQGKVSSGYLPRLVGDGASFLKGVHAGVLSAAEVSAENGNARRVGGRFFCY